MIPVRIATTRVSLRLCFSSLQIRQSSFRLISSTYAEAETHDHSRLKRTPPRPFHALPRTKRIPGIGDLLDIYHVVRGENKRLHLRHYDLFLKHGEICLDVIGPLQMVLVSDPEMAAGICREEKQNPRRKEAFQLGLSAMLDSRKKNMVPHGLAALEGEEWYQLRTVLQKRLLRPLEVKNYFDGFDCAAKDFISEFRGRIGENGEIKDVDSLVSRWAIDCILQRESVVLLFLFCLLKHSVLKSKRSPRALKDILCHLYFHSTTVLVGLFIMQMFDKLGKTNEAMSTFCFGRQAGYLSKNPDRDIEEFLNLIESYFGDCGTLSVHPVVKYLLPWKQRAFDKATMDIINVGKKIVLKFMREGKEALENGNESSFEKSFLSYLLSKDSMSQEDAITHTTDAFQGGLDTTGATASWLIYLLARHPEVQEKLYEEVNRTFPSNVNVTYDALQRMPYLRACLKEQMRLHPTAIGIARVFDHDIEAGGYHIPAETVVVISNYVMGRRKDVFRDPLKFLPERWLRTNEEDPNSEKIHGFASIPFGIGARSCVGRRIAESEIQTVITHMIKHFKFRHTGDPIDGQMLLLLQMKEPLHLTVEERQK